MVRHPGHSDESQDTQTHDNLLMSHQLLLDVVVGESPSILELLPSEDQMLLVWWNTFLVLNLCLDVVDRVRRLNLKGDCLSCKS